MIITLDEFRQLARPTSIHLDESHVNAYIEEAEAKYIIPAIGYDLYKRLMLADPWDDESQRTIILSGGEFYRNVCDCGQNYSSFGICYGLKKTTAYFTYALMQRADGAIAARAGLMRHRDEYADHVDDKSTQNNDVMDMAESYLSSVLEYVSTLQPTRKASQTRTTIKALGD